MSFKNLALVSITSFLSSSVSSSTPGSVIDVSISDKTCCCIDWHISLGNPNEYIPIWSSNQGLSSLYIAFHKSIESDIASETTDSSNSKASVMDLYPIILPNAS